ncbi:MAG: hypothetical protein U1G05_02870 [Kiritimatiellia bacterium]
MALAGLLNPAGFSVSTEACAYYNSHKKALPPGMMDQVKQKLALLEKLTGKKLGDPRNPPRLGPLRAPLSPCPA